MPSPHRSRSHTSSPVTSWRLRFTHYRPDLTLPSQPETADQDLKSLHQMHHAPGSPSEDVNLALSQLNNTFKPSSSSNRSSWKLEFSITDLLAWTDVMHHLEPSTDCLLTIKTVNSYFNVISTFCPKWRWFTMMKPMEAVHCKLNLAKKSRLDLDIKE